MNGKNIEETLNQIFANINEWLKFAEAKNGVLFAFNGAAIIGLLSLNKDMPGLIKLPTTWFLIPSLILSLIILLISFLPLRDKFFRHNINLSKNDLNDINLLFYGDLRKLSVSNYLKLLYESCEQDIPDAFSKLERDLAHQVLNNSAIAYNKYTFFTVSAYVDFFGILATILFIILKLLSAIMNC